jgi:hypothetical protein
MARRVISVRPYMEGEKVVRSLRKYQSREVLTRVARMGACRKRRIGERATVTSQQVNPVTSAKEVELVPVERDLIPPSLRSSESKWSVKSTKTFPRMTGAIGTILDWLYR